jgi:hypothetical protein
MKKFPIIAMYLALGHLFLVLLGVSYIYVDEIPHIGKALGYFSFASGASNSYGFFAPDVAAQLHVLIDVTDKDGKKITIPLQTNTSHEADLRLGNIVNKYFSEDEDLESLQRGLATSFAAKAFTRNPSAKSVGIRFEELEPVSSAEYRSGLRAAWSSLYETTFELDPVGGTDLDEHNDEYL